MSGMIERVARAIVAACGDDPDRTKLLFPNQPADAPGNRVIAEWELAEPMARAAIQAIAAGVEPKE